MRKAQINIEFVGGAIIFFTTLLFIMSSTFSVLPKYGEKSRLNELEITGWTLSKKLINSKGFWDNSTHNGTDWENHPSDVVSIGLAESYHDLDPEKTEEFLNNVNYVNAKTNLFKIEKDFRVKITEFIPIETYKTFEWSNGSEYGIKEPFTSIYNNSNKIIHFGSAEIGSHKLWVLATKNGDKYPLYFKLDSKDFSNCNKTNSSNYFEIKIDGRNYIHDNSRKSEVRGSERSLVMLRREKGSGVGEIGRSPPKVKSEYLRIRRYALMDSRPVEVELIIW